MPSVNPLAPSPTTVARTTARERLGDVVDVALVIAASPFSLCRIALSPRVSWRDKMLAVLALVLAGTLCLWAVSPSGIVAAALAIAFKWDLLRGFLYAAGMFFSPSLRWAVGAGVFVGVSALCLRALARPGR